MLWLCMRLAGLFAFYSDSCILLLAIYGLTFLFKNSYPKLFFCTADNLLINIQGFHQDPGGPLFVKAQFFCRAGAQVDDASRNKGTAIVDPHRD